MEPDPRIANARPLWAFAILLLPVVIFVATVAAYALLVSAGLSGRPANGERVTLTFDGCPEARPLVEARVADMGLPASFGDAPGGFTATLVLPADPLSAARVPGTLALPGALEVRGGDEVLATNADLVDASVRLDLMMVPSTLLHLRPEAAERVKGFVRAHPDGRLDYFLDGERIGGQSAQDPLAAGELEVFPSIGEGRERTERTAAWSVVVDHGPLPCAVSVEEAGRAPGPGGA